MNSQVLEGKQLGVRWLWLEVRMTGPTFGDEGLGIDEEEDGQTGHACRRRVHYLV